MRLCYAVLTSNNTTVEVISQMSDDEIWQIYPSLVESRVGDLKEYIVKLHSARPKLQQTIPHPQTEELHGQCLETK